MFIFRIYHRFNMPGSYPLSATFVWPIEIQVHCENQSSSMSRTRDVHSDRLHSSLITWGLVIGSGDKIACSRGRGTGAADLSIVQRQSNISISVANHYITSLLPFIEVELLLFSLLTYPSLASLISGFAP